MLDEQNRVNMNVMSQGPQTYDAAVVAVAADLNSLRKELPDMVYIRSRHVEHFAYESSRAAGRGSALSFSLLSKCGNLVQEAAFEIGPSREEIQLQQSLLFQKRKQAEVQEKKGKPSRLKHAKGKSTPQLPSNNGDPVKSLKATAPSSEDEGGKRVSMPKKDNSTHQSLELRDGNAVEVVKDGAQS